MHAGVAKRTKV